MKQLGGQRDSLAAELAATRRVAADVGQLRRLLGLGALDPGSFILADIVPGRPHIGDSHAFLVAKGWLDGVESPVGVLAGDGVVGVIRSAGDATATGHFWTHPEFRVSVRTESGSAVGIVRPREEDDGRMVMELEGTPYQEDVPLGSLLVTSGVSSLYPTGVPVGTVREVSEVYAGWAKSYLVEPAVRPDEANVVLVWRRPAAPE
jgi:rod shape-determining protein MreC